MTRTVFTPSTARRALESLRPFAERMCRLYRDLERKRPATVVSEQPVERAYFTLVWSLHSEIARIRRAGARVGDVRSGLVDFPARRAGRSVWLCWRVGERSVQYWHEAGEGFAGRQPVDEDGPWEGG